MKIKATLCFVVKWVLLFSSYITTANAFQTIRDGYLTVGVHNYSGCAARHFFKELAQKENLDVRWHVDTSFENIAKKLGDQELDVSAHGISNINKSAPLNALASKPYLNIVRGFTVLKKSPFASLNKLTQGTRVAVMNNSTALQDIQKNYPCGFFNLKIVDRVDGSTRDKLRTGEFEAIAEGYTGFWFNPDDAKDLIMVDTHPLDANNPGAESLVFWVSQNNKALLDAINHKLEEQGNFYQHYQQNGSCDTNYAFP